MMTCIAIDDEPKALMVIERYCQKIGLVSLKATFREPLKAIEFLNGEKVDLIFLDINMPEMPTRAVKAIKRADRLAGLHL